MVGASAASLESRYSNFFNLHTIVLGVHGARRKEEENTAKRVLRTLQSARRHHVEMIVLCL